MRFQVPQYVDIEDKIIGPFTLKQFFIYLAGVLLLIPVFLASDLSLFITIAVPIMGIAVLFAHFRLNGKSLFAIARHAAWFLLKPKLLLWRRSGTLELIRLDSSLQAAVEATSSPLATQARALETHGNLVKVDAEDPFATLKAPPP